MTPQTLNSGVLMIDAGDTLRPFELSSSAGGRVRGDDCVGKPLLLAYFLKCGHEEDVRMLKALADRHEALAVLNLRIYGVGIEPIERVATFAQELRLPFPLLSDAQLRMVTGQGVAVSVQQAQGEAALQIPRTIVFYDAGLRVARVWRPTAGEDVVAGIEEFVRSFLSRDEPRDIVQHAPVLLVPNVLPPDLCRQLIALWETSNEDSGFMKQVGDKTVGMTDYSHKIRRDHFMTEGPEHDLVKKYVTARVLPEVFRAFNYQVTRREDFRIACYDASRGGYFRPHRDNTTDGTAHRRFAMSLLLNDEYEGGFLRFPEYGGHRYRPSAGGACVFSCSLLHEATDVTAGSRFVLLSFFYGEAEARKREEYARRTGDTYRA
jgi:peroxiredoxin